MNFIQGNDGIILIGTFNFFWVLTGSSNDRKFPNTSQVFQMVFSILKMPVWLNWSCHKNCISVRISLGNFGGLETVGGFFVSLETVSYPNQARI